MATFNFFVDTKVTMWERANFEVEADTYNMALEKALQMAKSGDYPDMTDYETLYDTAEYIPVKENHGQPTKELYSIYNDTTIWTNKNSDE
jgi:hypothetical protein